MARTTTNAVTKAKPTAGAVVAIQEQLRQEAAGIQNRLGAPGGDVIQVTQDKHFKMPDGTKHPGPLTAVIVDFVSGNFFYEGMFDPNNITPPACFALGVSPTTLSPSDNSPVKQASECASCPMNQFGSDGKGKACKNTRLIALLPVDADDDTPLQILKVSPTAIKAFDAYIASVARATGMPPIGVTTDIYFDDKVSYASLRFGNPQQNVGLEAMIGRREEARKRLLTEPDTSAYDAPVKAPPSKKPVGRR